MTDSFEKLYDDNANLRQEIQANEALLKQLTDEQAQWVAGRAELERIKDGLRAALRQYKAEFDYGAVAYDVIEAFVATVEALCTSGK